MALRLLGNRIAVKPNPMPPETQGGIVIVDTANERPMSGVVVYAGPGIYDEKDNFVAVDIKVGDTVLYSKTAGTPVKVDDEELLIMFDHEVMAVAEPA